ncbi:MAG: M23 family metallopeptidase [Oscillospiraceae bacterium]|jgi:murein DD-endopeptidase MepM/ murein hydrolase activator NlpD|nr:M23 family metallopeptidase [Oscillospiraceae bacterium]
MKKVKFSGLRKAFRGKGFAAALVLSITAVGVSAYIAYNGAVDKLSGGDSPESDPDFNQDVVGVENPQTGIPKDNETTAPKTKSVLDPVKSDKTTSDDDSEEANRFIKPDSPKVMPADGEVINPFSGGELVKSNTLGVWRTHDAVDIAANMGSEVKAIQRGTVSEVYNNAMWGVCVTIDHGDGILSSYMGLDKDVKVEPGQGVEAGDVIALIGNTAESEIADPPHLHFAVRKEDEWIDPIAYINE